MNVCHLLIGVLAALLIAPATAQTALNGPYVATPAWDQTLPANVRFIVLANFQNDAVLDRETGLVWQRTPPPVASFTLPEASERCLRATIGGRLGWRLPTLPEMATLFLPDASDASATTILLPDGSPFPAATNIGGYWTATRKNQGQAEFFVVSVLPPQPGRSAFTYEVDAISSLQARLQPWCVRAQSSFVDTP